MIHVIGATRGREAVAIDLSHSAKPALLFMISGKPES
jgi:hypothetical protein